MNFVAGKLILKQAFRNRPDIRLNPDAGFCAGYFIFKMYIQNLEMHIFRHILTRIPSMKRGEKWFSENFRSDSFSIRTSRIESSLFRARVAKGRPAFRDRITRRSLESKIGYRGVGADFEKPK